MLTPDYSIDPKITRVSESANSIFAEPFNRYTVVKLYEHFQRRRYVNFFPILEAKQSTRAFIDDVLNNRFVFNHEAHEFGSAVNWLDNPSDDIEWHVFLHKSYYLVALTKFYSETGDRRYLDKWQELTESWIAQVKDPGFIANDITGRRIQNWIYAFYYLLQGQSESIIGDDFFLRYLNSLESQVNHLINNLAKARNHRTLELHAVILAAVVFPEFKQARSWLDFAITALADNAAADILADGVHCELSTYYHHIVLKNLLSVKRLARANIITLPNRFDAALIRALDFSMYIHKPDGLIPSLSDGDIDSFYPLLKLGHELYDNKHWLYVCSQGQQGQVPEYNARTFAIGGYFIFRSSWNNAGEQYRDARYLVFDCGPLGAGNHGHFDLLNIEVAAYGRSLIVDPGRYSYDESESTNWRVLFRSTGYHNTVEVNGKNQVAYQYDAQRGKFHVQGAHAHASASAIQSSNGCHYICGKARSHEYSAIHERKIFFANGEYWLISDILQDRQINSYALRYHLSAQAQDQVRIAAHQQFTTIESPNLLVIQAFAQSSHISIEPGFVSNSYGHKKLAPIINIQRRADSTVFESILFPYQEQKPEITLQSLDAEIAAEDNKTREGSCALALTINTPTTKIQDLFFMTHDGAHRHWHYQNIECKGSFCYLRLNNEGEIINYFTDKNTEIQIEGQPPKGLNL